MQKIHVKANRHWMNDPNGFIYYKGKYHLFYQCFPYEARWGRMHWAHVVSDDLVNWEYQGIAVIFICRLRSAGHVSCETVRTMSVEMWSGRCGI